MANRKHEICEHCNSQSLMSVLNQFVETVDAMDDKVMVPSRLQHMELVPQDNNNMALMQVLPTRGDDLYSHFQMINSIKAELLSGRGQRSSHAVVASESDGDTDTMSDDSSDDGTNNTAGKTAQAFRYHLQSLFGLLHQLTDTANFLGDAYENQVGGKKTKKFTI